MPEDRSVWRSLLHRSRVARRVLEQPVHDSADGDQVDTLAASPLFDRQWYELLLESLGPAADQPSGRREAAQHYLAVGRHRGLTPHPLFDPAWSAAGLELDDGERDPLVAYLQDRRWDVSTHPLFDVGRYTRDQPDALGHPDGPLGHYLQVGARAGATVNEWYRPDPVQEPRGLVDLLWRDAEDWVGRRRLARPDVPLGPGSPSPRATAPPDVLTTVVLVSLHSGQDIRPALECVRAQDSPWELVVVGVGHTPRLPSGFDADGRIRVVDEPQRDAWTARNHGLAQATGTHVAFLTPLEDWAPGRLSACHEALAATGSSWVHDRARGAAGKREFVGPFVRERLRAGVMPPLGSVVASREQAVSLGGFDESLDAGHALDFLLRLADHDEPAYVGDVGVTLVPRTERGRLPPAAWSYVAWDRLVSAPEAALSRHLVDWPRLRSGDGEPGVAVVVVADSGPAAAATVLAVLGADQVPDDVVVVDNDTDVVSSAVLGTLPARSDRVRLVRCVGRRGLGLATNLGLGAAGRDRVVLLDGHARVDRGWLAPLVAALDSPDVLGAQSLLLDAAGTIDSAGVVFPKGGGLPRALLQGFPVDDAAGAEHDPLHAASGAALAVRRADVAAVGGLDALYRHGLEDVDLCLRLGKLRPGHFVARPDSRVQVGEPGRTNPDARPIVNRRIFVSRWLGRLPEDDVEAWRRRGLLVVGHRLAEDLEDRRLASPEPLLVRPSPVVVDGVPRLRWAIKNPAPAGEAGEIWGDTWFVRHLAEALRSLGQEVVIDHRPARERPSEYLDDVVLMIRGRWPYTPLPGRVNLMWVISNPDNLGRSDVIAWDRVYVASVPFARTLADLWEAPAVPLLQATDPSRFNPDLAAPDTGPRALFVGNRRPEPRALVRAAVEVGMPLTVYGSGWEHELPTEMVGGSFLPNDELGAAYRSAGMVLNDHWQDMAAHGFLANRLFDSVAAGARVVSDDVPGMREVFGDAVQVVREPADLARLAEATDLDAIFGTDDERRARAQRVAAEHSFAARARTLLDDALRIRAERGLAG